DKRNLVGARAGRLPLGKLAHVLFGHLFAVAIAQHAFEHDTNRHGQPRNLPETRFFERRERIELAASAGSEPEFLEAVEEGMRHGSGSKRWARGALRIITSCRP